MGGALRLETLEDVFTKVHRAGSFARRNVGSRLAMDGTGAAALLSCALELVQDAQVLQRLFHGDLSAQVCVVYLGARGGLRRQCIDKGRCRFYAGGSRGD